MARMFLLLFCGVLFFGQFVVSNAAGYCQAHSPAVRLCNDDSGSAPIIYVDAYNVPAFENITCWCTLDIENWKNNVDLKVTRLRGYTSDIVVFINNNKVLLSSDLKTFSYTPGMAIKFELTDAHYKVQCYKFEIVSLSLAERAITLTCSRPGIRVPQTTTSTQTKPEVTTTRLNTDAISKTLETSHITTIFFTKTKATTGRIPTDAESTCNTIGLGIALGVAAGVVAVLSVTVVVLVFALRRLRNINRKPTEQPESATTYYNVANETGTNVASESSHNVNIQTSSDQNPPVTYESLQTRDERDHHSYQTVITSGDGEYVNADYEPMTNDKSTNYTTLQQPIEQEHVYKTIH